MARSLLVSGLVVLFYLTAAAASGETTLADEDATPKELPERAVFEVLTLAIVVSQPVMGCSSQQGLNHLPCWLLTSTCLGTKLHFVPAVPFIVIALELVHYCVVCCIARLQSSIPLAWVVDPR